jgi:hypothetical protein
MKFMIDWHRLFGLALIDFFANSPFVVELEKDLSLKRQLLDVVILRKETGEFSGRLPDGLDNLAVHNLLSYKSLREALDDWTLDELIGYYVNYRKQVSPSLNELLPVEEFRLYGVSTRFPQKLANRVELKALQTGVYEVAWGTHWIRVLVLSEMSPNEQNAVWNLFSAVREKVIAGAVQYRNRPNDISSLINQLFENYQLEGLVMPYTMEDFRRDYVKAHLDVLTPDEILGRFSADEVLGRFSTDEILRRFPSEEILRRISVEEIKAYLAKLEKQQKP